MHIQIESPKRNRSKSVTCFDCPLKVRAAGRRLKVPE
jgi:hypothetical protein